MNYAIVKTFHKEYLEFRVLNLQNQQLEHKRTHEVYSKGLLL